MTTPENGGGGNAGRLLLRSVRIDNYKCLSDFELPFGVMTLLLGKNGCGKTAVFEAINAVHRFVRFSAPIGEVFHPFTLTRWGGGYEQTFELRAGAGVDVGGEEYRYQLKVDHQSGLARLKQESLTLNGKPLLELSGGTVSVYDESHNLMGGMPYNGDVPVLFAFRNKKTPSSNKFYNWLNGVTMLSLLPEKMRGHSDKEAEYADVDGGNFASWYRRIVSKDESAMAAADAELACVLPGYQNLKLLKFGANTCELFAVFKLENGAELECAFGELSAGQRGLIAMYSFLHGGDRNRLLLVDEPTSCIAPPEVQPLLSELEMDAGDETPQIAMISHHPEAVSFISDKETVWMEREPEKPARIVKFENDGELHTSKLYARGLAP